MRTWKSLKRGEVVIDRRTHRAQKEFEALSVWLAGKGLSARKKLHELRKGCGAIIPNTMGIFVASPALWHADIRITLQYYVDKKIRIATGQERHRLG